MKSHNVPWQHEYLTVVGPNVKELVVQLSIHPFTKTVKPKVFVSILYLDIKTKSV